MNHQISFERYDGTTSQQRTSMYPRGDNSAFARLPHYDLLTFLAIAQTMPYLHLLDIIPRFDSNSIRRGASGAVHSILMPSVRGIVYKRFHVTQDVSVDDAFKALICELLVLEHLVLKANPNIQDVLAVAWDMQHLGAARYRVMHVLAFQRADHGSLFDFISSDISLPQ